MIQDFINQLEKKEDLDFHSMQSAIESIMTGEVDDLSIEAFLLALNAKGIKETEITAAAIPAPVAAETPAAMIETM